jgi:hypothetical protein
VPVIRVKEQRPKNEDPHPPALHVEGSSRGLSVSTLAHSQVALAKGSTIQFKANMRPAAANAMIGGRAVILTKRQTPSVIGTTVPNGRIPYDWFDSARYQIELAQTSSGRRHGF